MQIQPRAQEHKAALVLLAVSLLVPSAAYAHGVSAGDQQILDQGGLWSYIYVGGKHMLTGYDHLLFLAGVVFYLQGLRDILKFITVFTIGHCITLIAATYYAIAVEEHLIDAIIALSVLYKGLENLGVFKTAGLKLPPLLAMVFVFGLIHGLGLSTRLQSFDMGNGQFLLKILSFNLGVELGQVLALIPIVFLITRWQRYPSYQAFYKSANWYLVIAGIGLFIWQLYGYFTS